MTTLVLVVQKKESNDKTKYDTFYSHWKAETRINLYYNYIKHIKMFKKTFKSGYWFSYRS